MKGIVFTKFLEMLEHKRHLTMLIDLSVTKKNIQLKDHTILWTLMIMKN